MHEQSVNLINLKYGIIKGLAAGLARMHSFGFEYGCIRLENTVIGNDGFAKLIDYGLLQLNARMAEEQELESPETFASDVYSFATTAHEILCGSRLLYNFEEFDRFGGRMKPMFDFYGNDILRNTLFACWEENVSMRPSAEEIVGKLKKLPDDIIPIEMRPESVYMNNFLSIQSIDGDENVVLNSLYKDETSKNVWNSITLPPEIKQQILLYIPVTEYLYDILLAIRDVFSDFVSDYQFATLHTKIHCSKLGRHKPYIPAKLPSAYVAALLVVYKETAVARAWWRHNLFKSEPVIHILLSNNNIQGFPVDVYNNPLIMASERRFSNLVSLMLSYPILVDPTIHDNAAFRAAATNGSTNIVELLLKDPRVSPSALNNAALSVALRHRRIEIALLIFQDTRFDFHAGEPLVVAATTGNLNIVKMLLGRMDPAVQGPKALKQALLEFLDSFNNFLLKQSFSVPVLIDKMRADYRAALIEILIADPRIETRSAILAAQHPAFVVWAKYLNQILLAESSNLFLSQFAELALDYAIESEKHEIVSSLLENESVCCLANGKALQWVVEHGSGTLFERILQISETLNLNVAAFSIVQSAFAKSRFELGQLIFEDVRCPQIVKSLFQNRFDSDTPNNIAFDSDCDDFVLDDTDVEDGDDNEESEAE
ncbi:hypothetical protein HK100_007766 [Physocladia obscura]|uniref:Protein kinase domain-containing protein n=1 Tax=Physocladia obscura TaxID=109957 RepID=A0AAD5T544_9FUNG|nr:hypothetical protein HK100_007766 [Physocladia obscura]